jgi:hypothetical protein
LLRTNNQIKTNIKVYCPWRMPPNHAPMLQIYSLVSHTFITKYQLCSWWIGKFNPPQLCFVVNGKLIL